MTDGDVEDATRLVEAEQFPEAVQIDRANRSLTVRFQVLDRPGMASIEDVTRPVISALVRRFVSAKSTGRISDIRIH